MRKVELKNDAKKRDHTEDVLKLVGDSENIFSINTTKKVQLKSNSYYLLSFPLLFYICFQDKYAGNALI